MVSGDITAQKKAEAALIDSEKKYRALFEESRDVIYVTSRAGDILDMNRAGQELFGYKPAEYKCLHALDLYAAREIWTRFGGNFSNCGILGFEYVI